MMMMMIELYRPTWTNYLLNMSKICGITVNIMWNSGTHLRVALLQQCEWTAYHLCGLWKCYIWGTLL